MRPGHDLDTCRLGAVTGHRAMVLAVGADQVGQYLGIATVRFRSAQTVTVPIPGHGLGIDRIHLIARCDKRPDPQTTVCLDAYHHLGRLRHVLGDHFMEPGHTRQALRQPPSRDFSARLVHQTHIMMTLSPVVTHKQHPASPSLGIDTHSR